MRMSMSKEGKGLMYTGTHIRQVLARRERSARWLALKMGISPSLMSLTLDGKRKITPQFVERACAVLDLPPEALFFSADDMHMRINNDAGHLVEVA